MANPGAWENSLMTMRNLQIVTLDVPFVGFCEACKAQFRSYVPEKAEAERIIRTQFEAHECTDEFSHATPVHRKALIP